VKLVVGLGNPGPEYEATRHNVGFRVVEGLGRRLGARFEPAFGGRLARVRPGGPDGEPLALFLPERFMNRSGEPVARALRGLGIDDPAMRLLVVHDDLDLPPGRLRMRPGGGAGGHNGLGDVLAVLGRRDVPRLRVGVGRPPPGRSAVEHVLAPFDPAEAAALPGWIDAAADAAETFAREGVGPAMRRAHAPAAPPDALGRAGERHRLQSRPATPMTDAATPPPRPSRLADRLFRPFAQFMALEISSALVLLALTVLALAWANSPWAHGYEHLLHEKVGFVFGEHAFKLSVHHWVNDALMAIFFFLVGLEIKREMVLGDLSTRARAMLPVMGALGGMIVPALIYFGFHRTGPAAAGWGIPMATDIAFAVAAMSVLGSRVPPPLKIFLLALAIADDLGAVTVIAVFYTETIHLGALAAAVAFLAFVFAMNLAGVRAFAPYWVVGGVVWFFTHESGVHATIAGVALGLLTPTHPDPELRETLTDRARQTVDRLREWVRQGHEDHGGHHRHHAVVEIQQAARGALSPLDYLANRLERPVLFVIMPLFALANAGVALEASTLQDPLAMRVALAVALGLLVGKPLGITLFAWVAVKTGLAAMPRGVNFLAIFATGMLAGIGFTVALFISALAFDDPVITAGSKVGILLGSTVACVVGLLALARALPAQPEVGS